MRTYTLTENSIFIRNNFGEDKNKINEFFEITLESWLESANIPKEQVISAMVHHDQSTPHLHVSISSLYERNLKEFDKKFLTSNSKIFNIYYNLGQKKLEHQKQLAINLRKDFGGINDFEKFLKQETNNYQILGETMDIIQNRYQSMGKDVYRLDRELKIADIRGFDNEFLKNQKNTRNLEII